MIYLGEQEIKRYFLIEYDSEEEVNDFLLNWRDLGYFEVRDGIIVNSTWETILDDLVDIVGNPNYGILIPLFDCEVIARGYFKLGEEDLIERNIIKSNKGEAENLEPTGS